jgi:2-polyprenyl-6-methoxyphenol hydroxylase-like FAD-dependent oxidoreductase
VAAVSTASIGSERAYDAIVVGARAAGAATAMLLGRAGRRVLLVDRSMYGADTLSTHALMRGGVLQLRRWGLLDAIRAAGTPALHRATFHYGDEIVDLAVTEQHGVDALYAPRRTVLDPLLVDAARASGVEVVYGTRVSALRRDDTGRVTGVVGRSKSDEDAIADADIVVGADGMSSTIARLVDAPNCYHRPGASAFVYAYFPHLSSDALNWCFRPNLMAGVIPTNDELTCVVVGMPPARFAAAARRDGVEPLFRRALAEVAPEFADALTGVERASRVRSFPGQPGHLRPACGPGWALVGDAGCYKDPMSAHGITDALRDAELLVRSLVTTGDAAAYAATRDLLARPVLEASSALAAFEWDVRDVARLHLALKVAMDEEVALLAALDAERALV